MEPYTIPTISSVLSSLAIPDYSGFTRNAKWERRFQIPNQIILISTACVPLKPNEDDAAEARKLTAFAQQAMRRTAWDSAWVDIDIDALEAEIASKPTQSMLDKGKLPERAQNWGGPSDLKGKVDVVDDEMDDVEESNPWGVEGVGVKVWLRRTIIYQLSNLMERAF